MFGCCVAGRLVQTNIAKIDDTHAYFELPSATTINHVCVFLTGDVPFPDGYGATVHLFWPGRGFQLLGMLTNEKPSAFFRLRGTSSTSATPNSSAQNVFSQQGLQGAAGFGGDVTAILGLAIEPLGAIQAQMASLPANQVNAALTNAMVTTQATVTPNDAFWLGERIVKNLLNYLGGFTGGHNGADVVIPMSIIGKWYESFLNKLRTGGIGFLERQD